MSENERLARQLAADDLAGGDITPDQVEWQTQAYLRWLQDRRDAVIRSNGSIYA